MKREYKNFEVIEGFKFVSDVTGKIVYVGLADVEGKTYMIEDYYYFGIARSSKTKVVKLKEVKRMKEYYINRGYELINPEDMLLNGTFIDCNITGAYIEVINGEWYVRTTEADNYEIIEAKNYVEAIDIYLDSKTKFFKLTEKEVTL